MEKIKNMLRRIDFSSVSYSFHINGKESFKTIFGGTLYLGYFVFFVYFVTSLSIGFLGKLNYSVVTIDKILPSPPQIPLHKYNLTFSFLIRYDNNTDIPEEMYKKYIIEKVYFVTMLNSTKKIKRLVDLKPCDNGDLNSKFMDSNAFYSDFSQFKCLNDRNFTIQGGFNDDIFQYVEYGIYLNYTTFLSEKMTYANNFYGKNILQTTFKYFEMSMDVDNFMEPLKIYENNIFDYLSISKIRKVNVDFSQFEFQDNREVLSTKSVSEYFLKLGSTYPYNYDKFERPIFSNEYDLLVKYYIRSSPETTIVKRTYQKLWDFLANLSGLASQILLCIVFINTFYNKFKYKEELVNNLLRFKDNYIVNENNVNEIKNLQKEYLQILHQDKKKDSSFKNNLDTKNPLPFKRLSLIKDKDIRKIVFEDLYLFEKKKKLLNFNEAINNKHNYSDNDIKIFNEGTLKHANQEKIIKNNQNKITNNNNHNKKGINYNSDINKEQLRRDRTDKISSISKNNFSESMVLGNCKNLNLYKNSFDDKNTKQNKNFGYDGNLNFNTDSHGNPIKELNNKTIIKAGGADIQDRLYFNMKPNESREEHLNYNNDSLSRQQVKEESKKNNDLLDKNVKKNFDIPEEESFSNENINNGLHNFSSDKTNNNHNENKTSSYNKTNSKGLDTCHDLDRNVDCNFLNPNEIMIEEKVENTKEKEEEENCNISFDEGVFDYKNNLDIIYSSKKNINNITGHHNYNSILNGFLDNEKLQDNNLKNSSETMEQSSNNKKDKNAFSEKIKIDMLEIEKNKESSANNYTNQIKEDEEKEFKEKEKKEFYENHSNTTDRVNNQTDQITGNIYGTNDNLMIEFMKHIKKNDNINKDLLEQKYNVTETYKMNFKDNSETPINQLKDIRSNKAEESNSIKETLNLKFKSFTMKKISRENKTKDNSKIYENNKKIQFNFNLIEVFCKCCCVLSRGKSNKYFLYNRSFKSINDHLNIYFYLKMIQEIEIIKTAVFSYDHIGLINFISKPLVCDEVNSNLYDSQNIKEIFGEEQSLENALSFYRNIVKNKNLKELDHKLIKIFIAELDSILDHKKI